MKQVVLHGELAEKYGESFSLDIASPAEAIRALSAQLPGFVDDLRAGSFYLVRGNQELAPEHLHLRLGKQNTFHILPAAVGAKRGGFGKAILGVAIVAAAFIAAPATIGAAGALGAGATGGMGATAFSVFGASISWGNIALFGASMALQGIGSLLSPTPQVADYSARERPEAKPSFLFNGAVNTVEQGQPVPLIYGEMEVGSVTISGGLYVEQVAV